MPRRRDREHDDAERHHAAPIEPYDSQSEDPDQDRHAKDSVTLPCHTSTPVVGTAFTVLFPRLIAAQSLIDPNAIDAPPSTVSRNPHRRSELGFSTASIERVWHPMYLG